MGIAKWSSDYPELRKQAEETLKGRNYEIEDLNNLSPEKLLGLIHELQVHQIELNMQNDELLRIQLNLEKTRDKYTHLYDFAPVGYLSLSEKGMIQKANLTLVSMLKAERHALIGMPFTHFVFKDDQDIFYKNRQLLLETEKPQSFELRLVNEKGHPFHARIDCTVIKNEADNIRQIRTAVSDITDKKLAEEELRVKTQDLQERIKELDCLYTISDLRETPGISLQEIFQGVVDILVTSWKYPEIACAQISHEDKTYQTKNFQASQWKQRSNILLENTIVGYIKVFYLEERPQRDEGPFLKEERKLIDAVAVRLSRIIAYNKLMKELQKTNEILEDRVQTRTQELKRRTEQLSQLALQLTLTEERERRRIADLLHDDLQQLLVAVKMNLENLSAHVTTDNPNEFTRIQEMVQETLRKSRSLTVELSPPVLKVHGLVPALKWLASYIQQTHGLTVDLQLDPQVTITREDYKILLFQSVRELLLNAIKHAGVNSVHLSVTVNDSNQVCIALSDQGVGFDPDTNGNCRNAGFGLFSIRERLALLGGCLEVNSEKGKGTTCKIIAPLGEDELQKIKECVSPEKGDPISCRKGPNICVLLVDDHAMMREGLGSLLKNQSGIEVVAEAADGEQAIALAREWHPDVILMDNSMPKLNGIEATRIISSELPDIRIIGLSMYDDSEMKATMLAAGAVAYLTKDGNSQALLDTIRTHGSTQKKPQ